MRLPEATGNGAAEPPQGRLADVLADVSHFQWDRVGDQLIVSPRLAKLTGMTPGALPARNGAALTDLVHLDDRQRLREGLEREGEPRDTPFRFIRQDGRGHIWLSAAAIGMRGPDGELLRVIGVVRDISAERAEAERRDLLAAEADHRVRNIVAVTHAVADRLSRRTSSLERFLKGFLTHMDVIEAGHAALSAGRATSFGIEQIIDMEIGALARDQHRCAGPPVILTPRAAHGLALIVHELAANAMRYGALSEPEGRIDIAWRTLPNGGFEILWLETGGPQVTAPGRRGVGRALMETAAVRELGGVLLLDFPPEGLQAQVTADVLAIAKDPPPPLDVTARPGVPVPPPPTAIWSESPLPAVADIRGLRVLIVEDAVLLARELEFGLIESGAFVVGAAADLDQAERLLALDFDAAVLDANLNGRPVTPIAEVLARRGTPFIFATGYGDEAIAPGGLSAPVVPKPYNIRQIASALCQARAMVESAKKG